MGNKMGNKLSVVFSLMMIYLSSNTIASTKWAPKCAPNRCISGTQKPCYTAMETRTMAGNASRSTLLEAVLSGHYSAVLRLLQQKDSKNGSSIGDKQLLKMVTFKLGYFAVLNLLIQESENDFFPSPEALMYASCNGRTSTVGVLLRSRPAIRHSSANRELLCAIKNKHSSTVMALLNYGNVSKTHLEAEDPETGKSPIELALMSWPTFLPVLNKLLGLGVDPNLRSRQGDTLLTFAMRCNASVQVISSLLRYGANINMRNMRDDNSALHLACQNNLVKVVELLLDNGADFMAKNRNSNMPLHMAVKYGASTQIAALLLRKGTLIESQGELLYPPLLLAASKSPPPLEMMRFLLDHKANVNARDGITHSTALIKVASVNSSTSALELLLCHGADVNASNIYGYTALSFAADGGPESVKLLINNGANVSAVDTLGITVLMYAAARDHIENVKILLESGVDINATDNDGNDALLRVIGGGGSVEIVKLLLQHGISANKRNNNGETALYYAVATGETIDIIKLLLEHGAEVNFIHKDGNSLLTLANESNQTETSRLLIQHGADVNYKKVGLDEIQNNYYAETIAFKTHISTEYTNYSLSILTSNTTVSTKTRKIALLGLLNGYYKPYTAQESPITMMDGKPFYPGLPLTVNSANDPDGRRCLLQAIKSILDTANNEHRILPGYALELHYYDGDLNDMFIPRLQDAFMEQNFSNDTVRSPLFLGPNYDQCSPNTQLESVMEIFQLSLQNYYGVSDYYSVVCRGTFYITYHALSNSIEIKDATVGMVALLGFLKAKRFGFDWNEVALICDTSYATSALADVSMHHRHFVENGIRVVDIQVGTNYYDMFTAVKQTRARILVFTSVVRPCAQCYEIWCQSWQTGIHSDRYVFLMVRDSCLNCVSLEANCTIAAQQKQLAMTFFGMTKLTVVTYSLPSQQPYQKNLAMAAEKKFPIEPGCSKRIGKSSGQSVAAMDVIVYTLTNAIAVLDYAERELNSQYKLTLYDAMKSNNKSTMVFVRQLMDTIAGRWNFWAAPGTPYQKLKRTGVIIQNNFDPAKMDPLSAVRIDTSEVRLVAEIETTVSESDDTLNWNVSASSRLAAGRSSIIWATSNGQPPKDLFNTLVLEGSYNGTAFAVLLCLTAILSVLQIAVLVNSSRRSSKLAKEIYFDHQTNRIIALGCLFLNCSTIILLTGTEFYPSSFCFFRPLTSILSLTLINATIFSKMFVMPMIAHENRYISRKYRKPNVFNEEFHNIQRKKNIANLHLKAAKIARWILLTVSVLLIIWFSSDPMTSKWALSHNLLDTPFDSDLDSYYVVRYGWCESPSQSYWIALFAVFQCLLIGVAGSIGLSLKKATKSVRRRWKAEISHLRMAIGNAATVIVFVALMMIVLPTKPAMLWYVKTLAFAAGQVIYSASTFAIVYYLKWSPVFFKVGFYLKSYR